MTMFDAESIRLEEPAAKMTGGILDAHKNSPKIFYALVKRFGDFASCLLLAPFVVCFGLILLVLNPFFNKGPLLYRQSRMGKDCEPFTAFKFRSMSTEKTVKRGAFDDLEEHRITKLGGIIRKARIDELPQIINIIKGDMSLIGPRPDFIDHAREYISSIPGYRERHAIRPGVTGLAQVDVGYVSDEVGFRKKVEADLTYIREMGFAVDLRIMFRTMQTVFGRCGR